MIKSYKLYDLLIYFIKYTSSQNLKANKLVYEGI